MKQVLISDNRAILARVPRPAVENGSVLVQVHYSLISTGTELAPLRGAAGQAATPTQVLRRIPELAVKAARNPALAAQRLKQLSQGYAFAIRQRLMAPPPAPEPVEPPGNLLSLSTQSVPLQWNKDAAEELTTSGAAFNLRAGGEVGHYQASSQPITAGKGRWLRFDLKGAIKGGEFTLGLLSPDRSKWLNQYPLSEGEIEHSIVADVTAYPFVWIVIFSGKRSNERDVPSIEFREITALSVPAEAEGADDMGAIGWNVGYSAAGEVVAVGDGVEGIRIGDYVACGGAGQANHAEYISVKRNLVAVVPANCPHDLAATTTVGAIALQGVRRTEPRLGETVCVVGLGLLGLITCQLLKANGCRVFGIDLNEERAERAVHLGVDAAVSSPEEFLRLVNDRTGGHGADATIITAAAKSNALVNDAMKTTRRKGRVVIVGDVGLAVERNEFYRKEIDLLISTSYGPGRYDPSYEVDGIDYPFAYVRWSQNRNMQSYLDLIGSGRIDIASLIDVRVPFADAPAAYRELAAVEGSGPVGVLIEYPAAAESASRPLLAPSDTLLELRGHGPQRQGPIRYALVGAGAFGQSMLVPQMDACGGRFELRGVVSRDAVRGGNFARQRRLSLLGSDMSSALSRADIDLVVIATRHDAHADQAAAALLAGKHVFVEKPLALNWGELATVAEAYERRPAGTLLMVGFNRRFAPAAQALRDRIAGRRAPFVAHYRLNGGFIPRDSWVQGPQGGGRNLGEACHMYDFFRSLAGAPVKSIAASSIDPGQSSYLVNDNFVATLTYADGSLATLTYVATGPKTGLPKERVEVFCDGQAFVLDDFRSLTVYPEAEPLWTADAADKGHFEELSRFGEAIAEGAAQGPIPFAEIVETTAVSLHIEDLLQGRI